MTTRTASHRTSTPPSTQARPHAVPDSQAASSRQVFLLEPDTGTVCRILSLYAARGLALQRAQLDHAAPATLMLVVHASADAECLRILVNKARSLPGVIEAASD